MIQSTKLTNLQLELLKLFSREIPDQYLINIKRMLADYFSKQLTAETDRIWNEKGLTDDDMDRWLKNWNEC